MEIEIILIDKIEYTEKIISNQEAFDKNSQEGEDRYIISQEAIVQYKYKGELKVKFIEKGFICDLSSIPAFGQSIFPKNLFALSQAGIVHDNEYRNVNRIGENRKEVDLLYKAILEYYGFNNYIPNTDLFLDKIKWKAFNLLKIITRQTNAEVFYYVLRIFAGKYYKE